MATRNIFYLQCAVMEEAKVSASLACTLANSKCRFTCLSFDMTESANHFTELN